MAAADVQQPPAEPAAPAVPDYLASPNAVFSDPGVEWRYGKAPDYSKTRKVWEEGELNSRHLVLCERPTISARDVQIAVACYVSVDQLLCTTARLDTILPNRNCNASRSYVRLPVRY